MMFPKDKPLRDKRYRERPKHEHVACENCLGARCSPETVVGAHPRATMQGGTGYKPADDLILFLGFECHQEQEAAGVRWLARFLMKRVLKLQWPEDDEPTEMECTWLVLHVLFPIRRLAYVRWLRADAGQR